MTNLNDLSLTALAVTGITAMLVQLIKDGLVDPRMVDSAARNALLRSINYALNILLLVGALATQGQLRLADSWVYVALAFGQSFASHFEYKTLSQGSGLKPIAPPVTTLGAPAQNMPPPPATVTTETPTTYTSDIQTSGGPVPYTPPPAKPFKPKVG